MDDWDQILSAVTVALGGNRPGGRALLMACWEQSNAEDHAYRCVLAHYLADVQDDLDSEIAWDETALKEHRFLADDDLAAVGVPSARAMRPSLHLNLGDGYRRSGRPALAREQLDLGLVHASALGDDGYGSMIRSGLERLRARLDPGPPA